MKPAIPFENQEPQFPEKFLLQGFRPFILLVAVGFIVYAQGLSFGFIHSDDDILILKNFPFISNISNFFKAFRTDVFVGGSFVGYYRPLMTVSLMIDALFCQSKPVPFIFHLSNVLIHLVVACLTYLFFIKITKAKKISYLFAILFTVHPVLTQAVAPISGRNDTLLVLFALLSFLFFLSFLETRKGSYLFCHFVFFGLALFTKETAFVLLVLYPLYLYLIRKERIWVLESGFFVAGWAAIVVFWFLLREAAFTLPKEYSFVYMARSILSNSSAVLLFVGKIIFPFNLSVAPILQDSTLWYGIIATIVVVVLLIISGNRRFNYILFGFLWFLLSLAPILIEITPDFPHNFSEHRVYLPLLGFMVLLMEIDFIKRADFKKKSVLMISVGLILLFSVVNIVHGRTFKDRFSFWLNAVKNSPHYIVAHANLGLAYESIGNFEEAEKEYRECAKLGPLHPGIHNNLGLIYWRKRLLEEAEAEFKKALEGPFSDDASYNALINLGHLYYRTGREGEAEPLWKRALEVNPNRGEAYSHLTVYHYNLKDFPQAAYYLNGLLKKGGRVDPSLLRGLQPYLEVK